MMSAALSRLLQTCEPVEDPPPAWLTRGGRDVDVDADLGAPAVPQRRHASVGAEVSELEVDDVEVGGPWRDLGVGVGDDHPL